VLDLALPLGAPEDWVPVVVVVPTAVAVAALAVLGLWVRHRRKS
jgi:hypothetical protein